MRTETKEKPKKYYGQRFDLQVGDWVSFKTEGLVMDARQRTVVGRVTAIYDYVFTVERTGSPNPVTIKHSFPKVDYITGDVRRWYGRH